ncbi:hypothetical protein [Nocardia sp. NPDC048505]|uniref:hypothetical protein n=1 Tax=unclassified Nocardia TaxID=2637762 RepID=UPI0033C6DACE
MSTDREMRDVSPEQMAAIVGRAQVRPGPPAEFGLAPDAKSDRLVPRSVKLSDDDNLHWEMLAGDLGLSKSEYLRTLIRDAWRQSQRGDQQPEMVPVETVRALASKAMEDLLSQLSPRPGHAA